MAVTPKILNVDSWAILKTVMKTDLDYWKTQEAQALLNVTAPEEAVKMALSVIGASIGITEYYIDIMEKIENGELAAPALNQGKRDERKHEREESG